MIGRLVVGPLRFERFRLPARWTGGDELLVTGSIALESPIRITGTEQFEARPVIRIDLAELDWPARGLSLTDLRTTIALSQLNPPVSARDGVVTVRALRSGDYEARNVRLVFALQPDGNVRLELTNAEVFDGHLRTDPFRYDAAAGDVSVVVHVEGLALEALTRAIPGWEGTLVGRLDGRLPLTRTQGTWQAPNGRLELDRRTPATLHYPATGWLTGTGSPDSPRYEQLRMVEQGLENLVLEALSIDLPDPRTGPTAARIHLEGTSSSPRAVVPIHLTVNLNGQFEELLRLLQTRELEMAF